MSAGRTGPPTGLPPSEGDSARTIQPPAYEVTGNGSRGQGSRGGEGPLRDRGEGCAPSAFTSSRGWRVSGEPVVRDSSVVSDVALCDGLDRATTNSTDSDRHSVDEPGRPHRRSACAASAHRLSNTDGEADEHGCFGSTERETADPETTSAESGWEPATYRTRRRSETVRTVHHFPRTGDVDEEGRLRVCETARPCGDGRADVGGLSRERSRIDTVKTREVCDGDAGESDSSVLESPVTPTDEPFEARVESERSPFVMNGKGDGELARARSTVLAVW